MARLLLLATALLLACGCGRDRDLLPPSVTGPPQWHAIRGGRAAEEHSFTIEARSPCRVAIHHEGPGRSDMPDPVPRTFVAGSSANLVWERVPVTGAASRVPPAEDAAAGRTEPHVVRIRVGYEDSAIDEWTTVVWTRAHRGQVLERHATPPVVDGDLPFGSRIELAQVAVADVEAGEARLMPTSDGARLRMPAPAAPGDRSAVVRLWLEVLPP